MRQIVGLRCTICGKRISSIIEADFCPECHSPVHNNCAAEKISALESCAKCGSPRALAEASRRDTARRHSLSWSKRYIGGWYLVIQGMLFFLPGVWVTIISFESSLWIIWYGAIGFG